jgi:acyl carrier protein
VASVLPREVPGLVCRTVDLGPPPAGRTDAGWTPLLAGELAAAGRERREEAAVAYRGRERWSRSFEPVPSPAGDGLSRRLAPGSTIATWGRFRGALRAAAEHLVRERGALLAVIEPGERSGEPSPAGAAMVYAAPAADGARLAEIFGEIEARLGPLAGILVGELDDEDPVPRAPLAALGAGECGRRFAIVCERAAALHAALGERDLALCLRLLSREPLAAGAGDGLETALDHMAAALDAGTAQPWASLGWIGESRAETAAPSAIGAAVERLVAYGPAARFVASPGEPWATLASTAEPAAGTAPAAAGAATAGSGLHARPKLRNPYVAPESDLERRLSEMWQELLGIDQIGVHDSFFDLGGDSLLGTQVVTRVRERFGADVSLAALFEQPTVGGLAGRIDEARAAAAADSGSESEPERLERMLARLEDLTPEEVERMLAERGAS